MWKGVAATKLNGLQPFVEMYAAEAYIDVEVK